MTVASKAGFPFPLQLGSLDWFAHPDGRHPFSAPMWQGGTALVANGFVALEVSRGLWDANDFPAADGVFLQRFRKLPWLRFQHLPPDDWRQMDELRGNLFRYAPIYPWTAGHRCAPSPVWRVNEVFLARLSHLQLIARLPRCELHLGVMGPGAPLLFRFSGGRGMLAADLRLTEASFSVFEPRRHEDGMRAVAHAPIRNPYGERGAPAQTGFFAPVADPGSPDWPPEAADDE